jgi:DNA segregation ATPase FtsK/SpoIIIE, S-DNA-T family
MRKVITGEQVAQLYNRDPFALPVWRAPIYQTPAGFILLARLLARLIARHPLAAAILALLAFMWVNVGWLGLVVLAAWVVLVLAAWRFFWPGSFTRWVSSPARGRWRAWFYRRRWAGVMAISGVAPWHQGRVILPVLGKVSGGRTTLAGPAARHACPGGRRHRGGQSLAAVGPDPGDVPAYASGPGPAAGC